MRTQARKGIAGVVSTFGSAMRLCGLVLFCSLIGVFGVVSPAYSGSDDPPADPPAMVEPMESSPLDPVLYDMAYLDSMAIELAPGSDRPYLFSGNGSSFFYGTTATAAIDGWMGLHVGPFKLLDDWVLVAGGIPYDRAEAQVSVKPHEVSFRWDDGVSITVAPVGVLRDDLRFTASGVEEGEGIGLFFVFPAHATVEKAYQKKTRGVQYFREIVGEDTLFTAVGSTRWFEALEMRPKPGSDAGGRMATHIGKTIHGAMFDEAGFDLVFSWGLTAEKAGDNWVSIRNSDFEPQDRRRQWLLDQLNSAPFRVDDPTVNFAVNWAKIHLASLFAEDDAVLWAGLPWFSEGWARDTFISYPGATLVQGRFEAAARLLRTYARWQVTDPDDPDWGKVPNRARANDLIYNTADGTPWYIREVYEYGLYSGDTAIWHELWPTVRQSVEGALRHRVDDLGFLTHGEADTWMDAKGPNGAWSPRGNRAVEIQALWLANLDAALGILAHLEAQANAPDNAALLREQWLDARQMLIRNFPKHFVREDGLGLVDHLNPDGSRDLRIRPNQLWAVTVPLQTRNPLLTPEQEKSVVATVRDSLVYRWGVASLAQTDEDFHPYHQAPEYPKDAAYHMGIVWTWLSGPYKSASRQGWAVAADEIHQMLERGVPGTLSENLDALPRGGALEPRLSGTVSQAWSLAEFLRTVYQDYLGVQPIQDTPGEWSFDPRIPAEWGNVDAVVWMNGQPVRVVSAIGEDEIRVDFTALDPDKLADPIPIHAFTRTLRPMNPALHPTVTLSTDQPTGAFVWPRRGDTVEITVRAGELLPAFQKHQVRFRTSATDDEPLLQPRDPSDLKVLAPPPHTMLTDEVVAAENTKARVVVDADDPERDDTGIIEGVEYSYPTDSFFRPGILDLTHLSVRTDGGFAYFALTFRDLVDPGWHPYYGFQLTFATLAIQTGEEGRATRRDVGRNSGYILPEERASDRFIHVGGGFEIEDGEGEIVALHRPSSDRHTLGNTIRKQVSFAVPLQYLGMNPDQWRITLLVGGQDDHGGGGVGEFRAVGHEAGRWQGGGARPGDPNVYDILRVDPR